MKTITVFIALLTIGFRPLIAQEGLLINVYNRPAISLNGQWNYIVDPYENGFYNYRYEPFDQQKKPGKGAFFTNSKPSNASDLIEYDFDKSDTISVPGGLEYTKGETFLLRRNCLV